MNKIIIFLLTLIPFSTVTQAKNKNFEVFDLGSYKLHVYTSPEAIADVSAIGGKTYCSHFAPVKAHFSTMQISGRNALDAVLAELKYAKTTESELLIGSHGGSAKAEIVDFQIEYLQKAKELLNTCKDSDTFSQRLIALYPNLEGTENVKPLSKALYPDEATDTEKESVRALLNKYTKSVSDIDRSLARTVWAETDEISIINGLGQFFGFESIFNDFIERTFGGFSERQLSSVSEIINIYGDMAYVQFYWVFNRKDKEGNLIKSSGRETMICRKINNEWKINHIHYSGMPKGLI